VETSLQQINLYGDGTVSVRWQRGDHTKPATHQEPIMTATEYLLNASLLVFVLYSNLGSHPVTRKSMIRPLVLVTLIGSAFLGNIPGAGNDHLLEGAGLVIGVALGIASALLVRVRRTSNGVVATAGTGFAALWIAAVSGRVLFAYGADHWFSGALVSFSRAHDITSSTAWADGFVLMALAMVVTRVLITGTQAHLAQNELALAA
jgi:hypothetical protein